MKKTQPLSISSLNQLPRINDVRFSSDGRSIVYSSSEGALGVVSARALNGKPFSLSTALHVRGGIGYGGGEFDACGETAVLIDRSGSLYVTKIARGAEQQRITPAWGASGAPALSPDGRWVLYVFQDDERDGLAVARSSGITWPTQLAMGADFYMQPCWHPSGEKIAWVEWDHPHMPWDASRVKLGEVGGMQVKLFEEHWIAGGERKSASQPYFSPNGQWLSYIIRFGDWDNLVLYNIKKRTHKVVVTGSGFHLRLPEWVQGMRSYTWRNDSHHIVYTRYAFGRASLWNLDLRSRKSVPIETPGVSWITQVHASPVNDDLIFLGSSPKIPKQVCLLRSGQLKVFQSNVEKEVGGPVVMPEEIVFPTVNGGMGYAILYQSPDHAAGQAPLVIHIHGGPTSASPLSFSSDAAWFTSRGYAYAQLNYRGSSGYGYDYQEKLRHQWGIVDAEDTYLLARHLIAMGKARQGKILLMGSSAGGFTVLRVLIHYPGFFSGGICSYGVTDLLSDARNTHKFERFYHQFLTGVLPRDRRRFIERSPNHHIEKIKDPVALFHGDADQVVAVEQSLEIFQKLKAAGVPCELKVYEGEGHGFREPENVVDYYNRIEAFIQQHVD